MPWIATRASAPASILRNGLQVVRPAYSSGEPSSEPSVSGSEPILSGERKPLLRSRRRPTVANHVMLEHLIPQAWESHWPLDENQDDPTAWRSIHLHRLGKLNLSTGSLNSGFSNLPWHAHEPKDKRRGLVQHSLLKLNTTVVNDYPGRLPDRTGPGQVAT